MAIGLILSLLVAFQFTFTAVYLFINKKGNRVNNRLLGALFVMFAINVLDFTLRIGGHVWPIPLLHFVDDSFFLLYGPLLYLYTHRLVFHNYSLKRDFWHFIPGSAICLYLLAQSILLDFEIQQNVADGVISTNVPPWMSSVGIIVFLHILVYLLLSSRSVKVYREAIRNQFSSIDEINLDWLTFMIRAFLIITLFGLVNSAVPILGNQTLLYLSILILLIFAFLFINLVLVKALNQPLIFSGIEKSENEKYSKSGLAPEELESHKDKLTKLMQEEKRYLQTDLKIQDLAEDLDLSTKVLSQVINQGFKMNFYDFVNSYRCTEVKEILANGDKKMTVIEAMYEAGFNSKSSFNKEFKKLTGQTPLEYKRSVSRRE